MKTILIPTDFSELANAALQTAANIAKKTNAAVTLLHVIEAPYDYSFNVEGEVTADKMENDIYTIERVRVAKEKMAALENWECLQDIEVEMRLRVGNVYHAVKNYLTNHDIDLIVVGTSGVDGFASILIGSNTERLVREAKCPVLTVHKPTQTFEINNIVLATAMNDDETGIIHLLKKLQGIFNNTIHLVSINTPNNFTCDINTYQELEDFARKHQLENVTLNVFNDATEEAGIINFADRVNADLIAISTHGRTGIAHLLAGSIAEGVVNHAERPVLTLVSSED